MVGSLAIALGFGGFDGAGVSGDAAVLWRFGAGAFPRTVGGAAGVADGLGTGSGAGAAARFSAGAGDAFAEGGGSCAASERRSARNLWFVAGRRARADSLLAAGFE
ncbi:hypothetical protein LMG27198_04190 [Methylocystis echinoides]|uniref:Uncharacterized protein n=1 Tax=Methylocystis echinoides TaxID=29468 RepID=A0A9W6GQW9_9HYPH|nr:hypothetical protein LMG27198_04190 [Methylocystis echinoides]